MKRIFKTLAIVAVAAAALVACQNEIDNNQQVNTGKAGVSSFKFYVQTGDVATKATLEPNDDETAFAAAWEDTDAMALVTKGYNGGTVEFNETGTASWIDTDGAFEADYDPTVTVPTDTYSKWTYDAFYPWNSLSFESERTQDGSKFNSAYDLMHGYLETENCAIGKDAEDAPIVVPMDRLTAIAYYHIEAPNAPSEKVVSATLTATKVNASDPDPIIAADVVEIFAIEGYPKLASISTLDSDNKETGTNSITITFDEGTAPDADDFTLWFNLLALRNGMVVNGATGDDAGDYADDVTAAVQYNIVVDIETETHTARLTSKSARSFTAGKLNRAHITSNLTWTDKPLFYESFDKCESTGGNDNSWSGQIATSTFSDDVADNDGWVLVHGNAANAAIKLGTGSAKGSATTPAFNVSSDLATLTFKAAAWNSNSEATDLNVSVAEGTGVLNETSVTLVKGAWTEYTLYIAGAGQGTKIIFEAKNEKNNRFFLDEVKVVPGGTAFDYLSVSTEGEELDNDVTEASFTISANVAWTASVAEADAELDKTSGTGDATLTVTFPANNSGSVVTAATITVRSGDDAIVKTVTYTQKADENYVASKTIAEFIDEADKNTIYRLTGTVTSAINTNQKSFDLTDETGTIRVYGLDDVSEFVEGDIVTLHGTYTLFNNTTHEVVDGVYESHVTTPKLSVSATSISATETETSKTFSITADEGVAWSVASDNADLSFTPSSGTGNADITVSFSANTESTEKTATITVSSNTENVYKNRDIQFVQSGAVTGKPTTVEVTAGDTFTYNSTTKSLSYTEGGVTITQTQGTSTTQVGSTYTNNSTSNPIRVYVNHNLTFTCSKPIVSIVFTVGNSYTGPITANIGEFANYTWTGKATEVIFTPSGQFRPTSITITYLDPDGTVEDPTLMIDDDFSLVVGQAKNLTVNTNSDGAVTYESSDTDVATVVNGVVTAVATGEATITVNVAAAEWYNAASETVDVTVVAKAVQSVAVAGLKTSYATGDDFVASCTVTANYNDNTSEEVEAADYTMTVTKDNVAVTDLTNLAAGTYYAIVTYDGVSSTPIEITVSNNGGGGTYKMTPNQSSTGSNATQYITTLTEFTYDGITWKMNQWNPSTLQIKTNQSSAASEFRFYNTSAFPGRIKKVVITFSALTVSDASKLMFLGGTSAVTATTGGTAGTWDATAKTLTWTPGASDNFTYFAFYQNGKAASGTNHLAENDAIVVEYE